MTGVGRPLGAAVAIALSSRHDVAEVVGVDSGPPDTPPERLAALRGAGVAVGRLDLQPVELDGAVVDVRPDTVVHMGLVASSRAAGDRGTMKEINVVGTMHLLAGCRRTIEVRRLVVRSSGGVYGAGPRDPALFTEASGATSSLVGGWARDCADAEEEVRGLARVRPDIAVATLRLAHAVGPQLRTAFSDLFARSTVPGVAGHDGRLQFVHADDVVGATVAAALSGIRGALNVAGDGVLRLSQAAALARRPVAWLPRGTLAGHHRLPGLAMPEIAADDIAMLAYGRVLDTSRLRRELGYRLAWSTRAAFEDHVRAHGLVAAGGRPLVRLGERLRDGGPG